MKMVGALLDFRGGYINDAVQEFLVKTVVLFENHREQMGYQLIVLWISRFPEIRIIDRPRRQAFDRLDQVDVLRCSIDRDPLLEKRYQQLEIDIGDPFEQLVVPGPAEPPLA